MTLSTVLNAVFKCRYGATLIEYAVILGVILAVSIGVFLAIGNGIDLRVQSVANAM